jgi:hypothetical protein
MTIVSFVAHFSQIHDYHHPSSLILDIFASIVAFITPFDKIFVGFNTLDYHSWSFGRLSGNFLGCSNGYLSPSPNIAKLH